MKKLLLLLTITLTILIGCQKDKDTLPTQPSVLFTGIELIGKTNIQADIILKDEYKILNVKDVNYSNGLFREYCNDTIDILIDVSDTIISHCGVNYHIIVNYHIDTIYGDEYLTKFISNVDYLTTFESTLSYIDLDTRFTLDSIKNENKYYYTFFYDFSDYICIVQRNIGNIYITTTKKHKL